MIIWPIILIVLEVVVIVAYITFIIKQRNRFRKKMAELDQEVDKAMLAFRQALDRHDQILRQQPGHWKEES